MKIIEIIPQLSQGGAERFVVDLCNEFAKEHKVLLVVLHGMDKHGFFEKELADNVQLISLDKSMGIDWRLFYRIAKLIYKEKPDVVHTHLRAILYCCVACAISRKIKFIHTIHSEASRETGGVIGKWCRKFLFGFRRVHPITISEESQRSFREFYRLPSTLIYNGRPAYGENSDLSIVKKELLGLRTNPKAKVVVNVARISKVKNQIALANAIDNLNRNGYAIELAIIGEMGDKEIVNEINSLQSPHIHLLGTRTNPRDYMKVADAFCLTSVHEGMPITLIECFSVGAIPLCTPAGGIVNMIKDEENGLLAKNSAQEDIEEMFIRFLSLENSVIDNMKSQSKISFCSFNMSTCVERYIQTIDNL